MLKLNPSEIIKLSKLINDSLDNLDKNINQLLKENHNKYEELKKKINNIRNDTTFLKKITNEIEKATSSSLDQLLNANYNYNYYENKILTYYAKIMCDNTLTTKEKENKLAILKICYDQDEKLSQYCQRQNFINHYSQYLKRFDYKKFNLDKETVEKELIYIYDTRGSAEAYDVMRALSHNCPDNYFDYHFNPKTQEKDNSYYDFNKKTIDQYKTNSEIININGYNYEFTQVLPKDCTEIERIAYNFGKANVINTMKKLPSKYLDLCSQGNSNTIILTSDKDAMNNNGNWSGYYKPTSLFSSNTNMITIDIHGSFVDNTYYTQDTIIHEMGHKFDDMLHKKSFIDKLLGKTYYTTNSNEWKEVYHKYQNVVSGINANGYEEFPNINEFFGDTVVAYFKSPNELEKLCPEVYNLMNKMLI